MHIPKVTSDRDHEVNMRKFFAGGLTAAVLATLVGCASAPPPTVQTGPNAEVTADGLHRVDNSVMSLAWVKPDMDLSGYIKFMLDPVVVAYQRDPQGRRSATAGGNQNFALSPEQMENFRNMFREAVVTALTENDGYELVDAPAPDVLRVTAELVDLVVRVPTERSGRDRSYTRSYGEVTLLLELRDSESGEIFARAADRRDPTTNPSGNSMREVSPTFVRADTQRLFEYWANLLRTRLDEVRALEPQ